MNDFIGSANIVRYLSRIHADTLPHHVFLFVGPDHIGKTYLATAWASHLGSSENILLDSLKEDGSHGTISVEQVRECVSQLSRTSFSGSLRVVLINRGDDLSEGASNALLKSLEEPPVHTIFIVLATDSRALLQTIVSRCFILRFPLVSNTLMKSMLTDVSETILKSAYNRPGIAIQLMGNSVRASLEESRMEEIQFRSRHSFADGVALSELDDSDRMRIEVFLSSVLHAKENSLPPERIIALADGLTRAYQYMRAHISPARALEHVFL